MMKTFIHFRILGFLFLSLWVSVSQGEAAVRSYQVTGRVENISQDLLTVSKDGKVLEFQLSASSGDLFNKARVGDEVTVWYTFHAHEVLLQKGKTKQLPGEAEPKGKIILDDRVFYDAKTASSSLERRG